jgi:predicted nucleic-acid-binding protein
VIGFDTNVLLRVFLTKDAAQHRAARDALRRHGSEGVFVGSIVLAEFVWAARSVYRIENAMIAEWLRRIVEAPEFILEGRDRVAKAIDLYANRSFDLADCLLGLEAAAVGCSTTLTFDTDAPPDLFTRVPT